MANTDTSDGDMLGLATLGGRLEHVVSLVPDLSYREVDRLLGKSEGHTNQIIQAVRRRPKDPERQDIAVSLAMAYAELFGATVEWIACGDGIPPSRRAVASAVDAARREAERLDTGRRAAGA